MLSNEEILTFNIDTPSELNLAYMPFISHGGLFISTEKKFSMGDKISVNVNLPGTLDNLIIEGKVIWITPKNALYHPVIGVGIQFTGPSAALVRKQIESYIDPLIEVGGYTYGILET